MKSILQRGYLQVGGQRIYVSVCSPEDGEVRLGVVFAEPFGEEKRCSSRMLVRMAKLLAEQDGCAVLKFDFSGTGDSSGEHGDASMEQWRRELEAVSRLMLQQFPEAGLVLCGLRAGALTAAEAAAALPVKKLLLLSPLLSGEELLQELQRRQQMKSLLMGNADGEADNDFGGVTVSASMMDEMRQRSLMNMLRKLPEDCTIHLLHTTGAAKFPSAWKELLDFLEQRGDSVRELLRDRPFWGQLEYYESDLILKKVQEVLDA